MESGEMMFVWAVVGAMMIFAGTLFTVTWVTNRRK